MSCAGDSIKGIISFDPPIYAAEETETFNPEKLIACWLGTWLSSRPRKQKGLIKLFLGSETPMLFYGSRQVCTCATALPV